MASITVYPTFTPRVILVDAPDVTISVQELVNLINAWEEQPQNGSYPSLATSSGKTSVAGGGQTGITLVLQNTVLGFAQRPDLLSFGTNDVFDGSGGLFMFLEDTTATFQTDGVMLGSHVKNLTDESIGTVLEVLSETRLAMQPLGGGTDQQWDIGDSYRIWDVVACSVTGGNLTAVDDVGSPISPLVPTWGTQVEAFASTSPAAVEATSLTQVRDVVQSAVLAVEAAEID